MELIEAMARAKLAAEGTDDPTEEHVLGMGQHATNLVAMLDVWFEHHFGLTPAEAAAQMRAAHQIEAPDVDPTLTDGGSKDATLSVSGPSSDGVGTSSEDSGA